MKKTLISILLTIGFIVPTTAAFADTRPARDVRPERPERPVLVVPVR